VEIIGSEPVVLRVAPPPGAPLFWHEEALMRKEHSIRPYFAPIATLLPQTLCIDFTHQILDRDYLFQSFMPGEPWRESSDAYPPDQDEALWRQFARIARTIHGVQGDRFGYPHPGRQFASWSLTVLDFIAHVIDDLTREGLDATALRSVFRAVEQHAQVFDEITRPCLSHGDLWPFNMLVARSPGGPRICAVLDADRAWWCDPLADWTAHLFRVKTTPHMLRRRAIFWEEYGSTAQGPSAALRELVYDAMHTGAIVASAKRHHQDRILAESCDRLDRIPAILRAMLSDDG
jgi:aminoglycoside phosphotransferase (APT) family kinase protein